MYYCINNITNSILEVTQYTSILQLQTDKVNTNKS